MQLSENFRIAVSTLGVHKVRSLLTVLGTVIGVMSVVTIVSIIEGMNEYVSERLVAEGSNTFYVDKFGMITDYEEYLEALKREDFTPEDARAVERLSPSVLAAGAVSETQKTVRYRAKSVSGVNVQGVDEKYRFVESGEAVGVESGREISREDVLRRKAICVIGQDVKDKLFTGVDPIGKEIRAGRHRFRIVGVGERKGSLLGMSQDSYVTVPISAFRKAYGTRNPVYLVVKARDQASYDLAQDETRAVLRARRKVPFSEPDDFSIMGAETFMELYRSFTSTAYLVTVGIAAISLIVGGIVIMNIMLVSVTERTREIGIRKAIGARRGEIMVQFLIESLILSGTGGLIGVLLGVAIALFVSGVSPLPAAIRAWAILMGLAVACGVGTFFGIYPAARAAKLDPIVALRYE
ncbi:MAG: ABC transporter permease [Candidatus Eiseniibacteriota bacterium]|nr:MAG: ABC transporter permease [Candidatus Eisenbacteria bacterium]